MLSLLTQSLLLRNFAAAVQGSASALVDFTTGSVLLAVGEAVSSVALWMQWLILLVLQASRLTTSTGSNVDTWVAQFAGFPPRLAANYAAGQVTFSRFSFTSSALIAVYSIVQTADGTQRFIVQPDTTNPLWNAGLNGYLIPSGTQSATVAVLAAVAGSAGNVLASAVTSMTGSIPGIDTVTNALAMLGGTDGESDAQVQARFAGWQQSLSCGTISAVYNAVDQTQAGLDRQVYENTDPGGATDIGHFTLVVDDGTGTPSSTLLATIGLAVEAIRPIGSSYSIIPPVVVTANVSLTITTIPTGNKPNLIGPVAAAITAYIESLPIGSTLPITRLAQVAYNVDPSISSVTALTINSLTVDLVPSGVGATVRVGTVAVS